MRHLIFILFFLFTLGVQGQKKTTTSNVYKAEKAHPPKEKKAKAFTLEQNTHQNPDKTIYNSDQSKKTKKKDHHKFGINDPYKGSKTLFSQKSHFNDNERKKYKRRTKNISKKRSETKLFENKVRRKTNK